MNTIDVKQQVRLSLAKCVELVLSGIRFRLFRAAITVVIIALAVAFLMTMLTESLVARSVTAAVEEQIAPRRTFLFWVGRLSTGLTQRQVTDTLVAGRAERLEEFKTWGGLTDTQIERLRDVADRQKRTYLAYFNRLTEGRRRTLVGRAQGVEIIERLTDDEHFRHFERGLEAINRPLPTSLEAFRTFLDDWQETRPWRAQIIAGHREALTGLEPIRGDRTPQEMLAEADPAMLEKLSTLGFRMRPDELETARSQAALNRDAERVLRTLGVGAVKQLLARRVKTKVGDVNPQMLLEEVRSARGAEWLRGVLTDLSEQIDKLEAQLPQARAAEEEAGRALEAAEGHVAGLRTRLKRLKDDKAPAAEIEAATEALAEARQAVEAAEDVHKSKLQDLRKVETSAKGLLPSRGLIQSFDLSAERITVAASNRLEQSRLSEVEANLLLASGGDEDDETVLGFSNRTLALIAVSFLVCIVGIANAMLMSVMERFREIATMKCLGATDGFIMINFILESCMQGIAGGVIGGVLGLLLGALRSWAAYGWLAITEFPLLKVLEMGGISLGVGVLISALAAVYPAYTAARLAPMEAMRIE